LSSWIPNFNFQLLALLEYALVNYTFFGKKARLAKKKLKESLRQCEIEKANERQHRSGSKTQLNAYSSTEIDGEKMLLLISKIKEVNFLIFNIGFFALFII
jgi:hypothetical protein